MTGLAVAGGLAAGPLAKAQPPNRIVWLDQNWSEAQRQRYHHQSQGTLTVPIETRWFMALQQPEDWRPTAGRFSDPVYLQRFGFIPSPTSQWNPDGLPIGFARTAGTDPRNGQAFDRLGFTCAACHTARIDHQDTTVLIDGGPAMIDLTGFGTKLALALGETWLSPTRFRRFANRVLGEGHSREDRDRLHDQIGTFLLNGLGDALQGPSGSVTEGFGRLDALNRIGNTVFGGGLNLEQNRVPTTAPVAYPHIWDASWFTWVQYNGSIEQPMVRNAGEAMGVSAVVNYHAGPTPRFTSTIPVDRLYDVIERSLAGDQPPLPARSFSGLRSPQWPEPILGTIDRTLAARGAVLYRENCQGCHLPAPNTPEFWDSSAWQAPNSAGERYLNLRMVSIATIGTDPAQAEDMANRTVEVPPELGLPNPIRTNGQFNVYGFGPALGDLVARVVGRWYDAQTPPTSPADRTLMNGNRDNGIRAPLGYKARPLNGIWATAPYLHNGSVPTLWHLLSPYRERPSTFRLGSTRFDPARVGYISAGDSRLNTNRRGNLNGGHLFDSATPQRPGTIGATFTPDDRRALVEYLKTL